LLDFFTSGFVLSGANAIEVGQGATPPSKPFRRTLVGLEGVIGLFDSPISSSGTPRHIDRHPAGHDTASERPSIKGRQNNR
jgi:hypothetical protein